jgi:copper homeostasis protein (lipoprotein)
MGNIRSEWSLLAVLVCGFICVLSYTTTAKEPDNLGGTSWELVKFQGRDEKTLAPDDRAKYTVAFESDGTVSVRIDCNRGRATWKSEGPDRLRFRPLALARAMCPPAPLNDRIVKDWPYVRSYVLKDGHLFLSLTADEGIYDFEPMLNGGQNATIPDLPATFVGNLPCADCPGIRYQLNLFPDHTFVSRMSYEERNNSYDERGRWQITSDAKTLVLQPEHRTPEKFSLKDVGTLRKLDVDGHEIEAQLNYDLKRAPKFTPLEPSDRGIIAVSLEGTYWRLVRLGNAAVGATSHRQEAYLILDPDSHRVSGSGGCNRLMGSYEVSADRLTFTQMANSMMACLEGMDTEKAFLSALTQVKTWKIEGRKLCLFDASGHEVARLEVRDQK